MSNLRLFTSNRLENLADELADVLRSPLKSPFDAEVIMVQSRGMERWISMGLAERHGICANIRFPFPNAFINELLQKVFPHLQPQSPFDPAIMTWKIMGTLPALIKRPGFESLRIYLEKTEGPLRLFQLSERIADLFDQYLLFRPEMMLNWDQGKEDHWQAVLWREVVKGREKEHRAALGKTLIEWLEDPSRQLDYLPERVSVFGISTLPKFHIQVFAALSRITPVHLFLMNPCQEYWGDIPTDWQIKTAVYEDHAQAFSREDLHLEPGNSLLASMGTLGRDFFDLINEFDCEEIHSFEPPGEDSLLACIQTDILNLRDRAREPGDKKAVSKKDASLEIHSCHSPMREVQVLHDRLLEMFENNPNLKPKDILVMNPDIEVYAPYIQAVFDLPLHDPKRIPFSIADQSVKAEGKIIDPFLGILDLADSRFNVSMVMRILESQAVQHRFGLSGEDVGLIQQWVEDSRIRWGVDGPSRAEMGLPDQPENTWKAGLERLLLGYAMPGGGEAMFRGVLPYDHMEGSDTPVLGRFLEFTDQLFRHAAMLREVRTLEEWTILLKDLVDTFFLSNETTELEFQIIQQILHQIFEAGKGSGFDQAIDLDVIRYVLSQQLQNKGFGFGFMTGGVTFCAMLPMRSIPFKVICLLGLNGDSYPRQSRPLGFDLMAKSPRKGDRSRRNDDRHLFLEAMLSARQMLYISHVGQSLRDNTQITPSVLVSELMDYIQQGFRAESTKFPNPMATRHPLQPFSPDYFKPEYSKIDNRLFSYSREHLETAKRLKASRKNPNAFISGMLPDPGEEWKTVDIDDLCWFFHHPTRFLLNQRLGIYLDDGVPPLPESESFDIFGLEKYLLAQDLMKRRVSGNDLKEFFSAARAEGRLPHGTVGEIAYDGIQQKVEAFFEKTEPYIQGEMLVPLEVDLDVAGFRLIGRIHDIYPERMIRYRHAKIKSKDRLRGWIEHLILNRVKPSGYPRTTLIAGLDQRAWGGLEFPPVGDADNTLETLLDYYWKGLVRPVHFFPDSSLEYAQQVLERKRPLDEALQKARHVWAGDNFLGGETEDPYYQLCFENTDPLDSGFQDNSMAIFGPIMAHGIKIEE